MAAGSAVEERHRSEPLAHAVRTPIRLAVTLVVASGLAVAGCAGPLAPSTDTLPPAAAATPSTPVPPTSAPPTSTPPTSPEPEAADAVLNLESYGPAVLELQQRLSGLGYWLGEIDGYYGQLTRQAVMAFQKAEGLDRDGIAGPQTRGKLPTATRPTPRTPEDDRTSDNHTSDDHTDADHTDEDGVEDGHIEVDLERQLLLVVRGGQVQWALNTSTGNGESYDRPSGGSGVAHTPRGDFEIERQINGVREAELGVLYRPKYFHGGIAVHGAGSIPAHPASHGCVRVTNSAMDLLWASNVAPVGTEVIVY